MTSTMLYWERRFATGDAEVDFGHQVLFALVNELHCLALEGCRPNTLRAMLAEIAGYARRHFATEEALMEAGVVAGLGARREENRRFCERLAACARSDQTDAMGALQLVYELLEQHIAAHNLPTDACDQPGHRLFRPPSSSDSRLSS